MRRRRPGAPDLRRPRRRGRRRPRTARDRAPAGAGLRRLPGHARVVAATGGRGRAGGPARRACRPTTSAGPRPPSRDPAPARLLGDQHFFFAALEKLLNDETTALMSAPRRASCAGWGEAGICFTSVASAVTEERTAPVSDGRSSLADLARVFASDCTFLSCCFRRSGPPLLSRSTLFRPFTDFLSASLSEQYCGEPQAERAHTAT